MEQSYSPGYGQLQPDSGLIAKVGERPSGRPFALVWQVLGSNQRRRCRQIYRPLGDMAVTRLNTQSRVFQGPHRDRTTVIHRRQSLQVGHPVPNKRDLRRPAQSSQRLGQL